MPLSPPKSLEHPADKLLGHPMTHPMTHPADKLLARMEQAATRPKKLDDTETETVMCVVIGPALPMHDSPMHGP